MANTHELLIAPDVAALIPAEAVTRFRDDPDYEDLKCLCGQPIAPGAPAALVVLRDVELDVHHLSAAHPACQPSAVIDADLSSVVTPSAGHDIQVYASLLKPLRRPGRRTSPRSTAALIVGTRLGITIEASPTGDLVDVVLSRVMADGLDLVTAIRPQLDNAAKDGWLATLTPAAGGEFELHIDSPCGLALVRDVSIEVSPAWVSAVRETGRVNLYVGTFHRDPYENPDALFELVEAGRVAGGRIPATFAA